MSNSMNAQLLKFANLTSGVATAYDRITLAARIKSDAKTNKTNLTQLIETVKDLNNISVSSTESDDRVQVIRELTDTRFKGFTYSSITKGASAFEFFTNANIKIDSFTTAEQNMLAHTALQVAQLRSLVDLALTISTWANDERANTEQIELFLNDEYTDAMTAKRAKKIAKQIAPVISDSSVVVDDTPELPLEEITVSAELAEIETSFANMFAKLTSMITEDSSHLSADKRNEYAKELRSLSKLLTSATN